MRTIKINGFEFYYPEGFKRPRLRKDLPEKYKFESTMLTLTPVGQHGQSTEKILGTLLHGKFNPSDGSWEGNENWGSRYVSEVRWALSPPCGPKPALSDRPKWLKKSSEQTFTVYIIKFPVKNCNNKIFEIYKPGITKRNIVGKGGRYSRTFDPQVVYERLMTPEQAWITERKLLMMMPKSPFAHTFEDHAQYWRMLEDLNKKRSNFSNVNTNICRILRSRRIKDGREFDRDDIKCAKSDSLGETEWRVWPYSIQSLVDAADDIVKFTVDQY